MAVRLKRSKVTLYVKSIKTTETKNVDHIKLFYQDLGPAVKGWYVPPRAILLNEIESVTSDKFVLPDDQKKVIQIVAEIAHERGFRVKLVDMTRMNSLHRFLGRRVHGLNVFPTLMTGSGKRLSDGFSKEGIRRFLSEAEEQSIIRPRT